MRDLFYPTHPPIKGARKVIQQEGKNPRAEQLAAYYRANRERIRAKQAEYYQANKERIKKQVEQYRLENPDKVRAWKRSSERYRLSRKQA